MACKQQSLAFDAETIAQLDDYVRKIEAQHPGLRVSRSSAVRALIRRGLAAEAQEQIRE